MKNFLQQHKYLLILVFIFLIVTIVQYCQNNTLKKENQYNIEVQLKQLRERELYYKQREKTLNATIQIYESKVRVLYQRNDSLERVKSQVINQYKKRNEKINHFSSLDISSELTGIFSENNIE